MIRYKEEHDWFFLKEKNKFLSIINSYPQEFLLYCVILLSGLMQGIILYVLDALDLLPLTHKKTKTNRLLLRDRQGLVMTRPQEFSSRVIRGKQQK